MRAHTVLSGEERGGRFLSGNLSQYDYGTDINFKHYPNLLGIPSRWVSIMLHKSSEDTISANLIIGLCADNLYSIPFLLICSFSKPILPCKHRNADNRKS